MGDPFCQFRPYPWRAIQCPPCSGEAFVYVLFLVEFFFSIPIGYHLIWCLSRRDSRVLYPTPGPVPASSFIAVSSHHAPILGAAAGHRYYHGPNECAPDDQSDVSITSLPCPPGHSHPAVSAGPGSKVLLYDKQVCRVLSSKGRESTDFSTMPMNMCGIKIARRWAVSMRSCVVQGLHACLAMLTPTPNAELHWVERLIRMLNG